MDVSPVPFIPMLAKKTIITDTQTNRKDEGLGEAQEREIEIYDRPTAKRANDRHRSRGRKFGREDHRDRFGSSVVMEPQQSGSLGITLFLASSSILCSSGAKLAVVDLNCCCALFAPHNPSVYHKIQRAPVVQSHRPVDPKLDAPANG